MRQQAQAFRHDPPNGIYGDCFRTAVACLLELPRDDVPHVFENGENGETADRRMNKWLAERGLTQFVFALDSKQMNLEEVLGWVSQYSFGVEREYLLYGTSKNGTDHVVVCKGDKIAWDPALDKSGIVGPCSDGHWWVVVIGVTRPAGKLLFGPAP